MSFSVDYGLDAQVPGGIYTDLRANGTLREDPLMNSNDLNYRWASTVGWNYTTTFQLPREFLQSSNIELVLHGVDTVSSIYINGRLIGNTNNMFVSYTFDIKPFVSDKPMRKNEITVAFQSALKYSDLKYHEHNQSKGYVIPPVSTPKEYQGEPHANFIRKMQCSFSWDWGPAFPGVGIWKPIEIKAWNTFSLSGMKVTPVYHDDNKSWVLDTEVFIDTTSKSLIEIEYVLDGKSLLKRNYSLADDDVLSSPTDGSKRIIDRISVPFRVILWWPNNAAVVEEKSHDGQRASGKKEVRKLPQKLYKFNVVTRLPSQSDHSHDSQRKRLLQTKQLNIGFRTIELVQDPLPGNALSFYFKVNGHPMFMKGSNWIPSSIFPENMTNERIELLLRSASDANMNMLRVWGGGVYESDYFYDLADRLGILIWQDFMFACALYPVNDEFLETVKTEATQVVRRLQHHPSIAIWAGNNENEVAIMGPWYPEVLLRRHVYYDEYRKLYVDTIRRIVVDEDPSRPFVTSSPSNGVQTEKDNYLSRTPNDNRYGDVHFYDYSNNLWDWNKFPSSKFCSEYGVQGLPSLNAWKSALSLESHSTCLSYPFTDCIRHREHAPFGLERLMIAIQHNLIPPSQETAIDDHDGRAAAFEQVIHLSQINQAMSIKAESEFYRRNRKVDPVSGEGNTYGALYWQLNDVWVAPTWSSLELSGNYKMLHYYAKEFFAPLILVPFFDKRRVRKLDSEDSVSQFWPWDVEDVIRVHAVSDFLTPVKISVVIQAFKLDSRHKKTTTRSYETFSCSSLSLNSSTKEESDTNNIIADSREAWRESFEASIDAGSVEEVCVLPVSQVISRSGCTSRNDCILRVSFDHPREVEASQEGGQEDMDPSSPRSSSSSRKDDNLISCENFLLFSAPKDSHLLQSNISILAVKEMGVTREDFESVLSYKEGVQYEITLQSDAIALFVWLSFQEEVDQMTLEGSFDRNGFIFFQRQQKVVFTSRQKVSAQDIKTRLKIQSLN